MSLERKAAGVIGAESLEAEPFEEGGYKVGTVGRDRLALFLQRANGDARVFDDDAEACAGTQRRGHLRL